MIRVQNVSHQEHIYTVKDVLKAIILTNSMFIITQIHAFLVQVVARDTLEILALNVYQDIC